MMFVCFAVRLWSLTLTPSNFQASCSVFLAKIPGFPTGLRLNTLMFEGPEFGSLLNMTAGLNASLLDNALVLEGPEFGEFRSLLNVTAGLRCKLPDCRWEIGEENFILPSQTR